MFRKRFIPQDKRFPHQTFLADHARSFEVALVGDEDDGPTTAGRRRVLVPNARQNVGRLLIRASVGDGVDNDVSVHVILLPYLKVLQSTMDALITTFITGRAQ